MAPATDQDDQDGRRRVGAAAHLFLGTLGTYSAAHESALVRVDRAFERIDPLEYYLLW